MRQLGTLPDAPSARTLADYLLSQSIDTRLEQSAGGWTVWVCDEDKLERAREEFQGFLRDPAAERFQGATKEAQKRRAEQSRKDAEWTRRQKVVARVGLPRRRLTVLLIAVSVICTVMANSRRERGPIDKYFYITEIISNENGQWFYRGLPELTHGQVWRLVTPIFIHFSVWHLLFNLLWLVALGGQLEARYGIWRYGLLILLTAAASNLCQYLFSTVTLEGGRLVTESWPLFGGMSGVVYGLFGFVWMKTVYEPGSGLYISPGNVALLLVWLVLCMTDLMVRWIGPVANTAHVVGLVMGMIAGYASAWWNGFGQPPPEASDQ
jgi:GlpG protein